jgi:hypothetical protein
MARLLLVLAVDRSFGGLGGHERLRPPHGSDLVYGFSSRPCVRSHSTLRVVT